MQGVPIVFIISWLIIQSQCERFSCRTNCSMNETVDEQCWHEALNYRSSELIDQLFSFSSLSVYLTNFQKHHPSKLNDSMKFLENSLNTYLANESYQAKLNPNLFTETTQMLSDFCRNLTSTPLPSVDQLPSLSCSITTCSSEILNYTVLFIITTIISSLILIICLVQSFQTRRKAVSTVTVANNGQYQSSLSTTYPSVNT